MIRCNSLRSEYPTLSSIAGNKADVTYLFMEDICGDNPNPPRHAKAYGNLLKLREQIKNERLNALKAFKKESIEGVFPGKKQSVYMDDENFDNFIKQIK